MFSIFLIGNDFMPRPRKYVDAVPRCFHVDRTVYERLRHVLAVKLGKSMSEEVNVLLRRRLEELEGSSPMSDFGEKLEYEGLKREYERVVVEVERLKSLLKGFGCYDGLRALAYNIGLDFTDIHNAEEIIPKLFEGYNGPKEHIHIFISLLEAAKRKKTLEAELTKMRLESSLRQ